MNREKKSDKKSRGMFDVGAKPDSYRTARAKAVLNIEAKSAVLIRQGNSPKGDIVEAAKVAATSGAKKTSDLIPYCHPIPIDHIKVQVSVKPRSIEVDVEVKSIWKTGVEMEALSGACIGALTIYDMLKPIDDTLFISSVKLVEKSGGLGQFAIKKGNKIRAGVIVVSDSVAAGKRADKSGKFIVKTLKDRSIDVVKYQVVPDDSSVIEELLMKYSDDLHLNLILTTGGTGLGPRDVTPEATRNVLEREIKGIVEASRAYGQRRTPLSMLSRGVAGVRGKSLIINIPGSLNAVSESLEFLFPGLEHAFKMMEGHGH
ncbi:MAG TPA: bifunctional molybdenum cofactor biosynthesis protein MoaC/MoaB [Nitrososphaeraceae archaeon]|nr:bifunctional molybdenum cofactor biosynthesis protein MoaC/MoaB [Nitrososphaeraceae archaeon]